VACFSEIYIIFECGCDFSEQHGVNSSYLSSKDYELSIRVQSIGSCTTSMGLRFCSFWQRMLDA
jgi:hypothetical protein